MADDPKAQNKEYQLIGPSEDGQINDLLTNLSPKDGRQRLQALIAEWLRMENLVVLTGSGTSVSSGGKTMEGLEREVLATLKAHEDVPATVKALIDLRLGDQRKPPAKLGFEDWLSIS